MKMNETEFKKMLIHYEIRSSLWARHIGISFLQTLVAHYFVFKVNFKYERLKKSWQHKMKSDAVVAVAE